MFDYSTYLLEIDKATTQIHDDICHRRFGQAQQRSMELLISARQLQLWLKHKHEEEMERSNGAEINHAVDASIYNSIGAMGVAPYPQPPVSNGNYPYPIPSPPETWMPNTYGFRVQRVENGWTIAINGKQWICTTPQELGERMVAILVEERLEK